MRLLAVLLLAAAALGLAGCGEGKRRSSRCRKAWEHIEGIPRWDRDFNYMARGKAVFKKVCDELTDDDFACIKRAETLADLRSCDHLVVEMSKAYDRMAR